MNIRARSRGPFRISTGLRAFSCCFSLLIIFSVWSLSIYLLELLEFEWGLDVPNYDYDHNIPINGSEYIACPIPSMDPFAKSVQHLLAETPPPMECETSYPLLFNSTLQSTIVPAKEFRMNQTNPYESCCYRTVRRGNEKRKRYPDAFERLSPTCFNLSLSNETKIPVEHEFIAIYCQKTGESESVMVDVHAFVPLKLLKDGSQIRNMSTSNLNVVIFGMDSVSRMSFIRTMPESYSYLTKELDGVEMLGYNKMEESTFPNIMPMLASTKPSDESFCILKQIPDPYQNCPFIWKKYAAKGYYTSFSEDAPKISVFNMDNPGFTKQPTDYYLRPLSHWADNNLGSYPQLNELNGCYGPRLTFQYLLDYMEKLMYTMRMNQRNFFHFSWATALTHDYKSAGKLGDPHLLRSLKWMKESGYLNDTVFILMSDHGHRGDDDDEFRKTIQGQLEDRLPLLFFVFPDSFKTKYEDAYLNLVGNRDRLVTTFDLYETLNDILNPEAIKASSLVRKFTSFVAEKITDLPRGISLFHSIPKSRTCKMGGIKRNFCSCNL